MIELSDNAKQLAQLLCGEEYELEGGSVRAAGRRVYHASALLEIASAALELAGEKVEYAEVMHQRNPCRHYNAGSFHVYSSKWGIWIDSDATELEIKSPGLLAAILLHAARTAREWASEGGRL